MMINAYIGELAALATSLFFSISSVLFTYAGRRLGAMSLNRVRILMAFTFLTLLHLLLGIPLPLHAEGYRWGWLALSGVIGLAMGDIFLFQAYIYIGPRLTMLVMCLHPAFSTIVAWILSAEKLTASEIAGMLLVLVGVGWVVLESGHNGKKGANVEQPPGYWKGILLALGATICQSLGLLTARPGLVGDFPALSGTLIRMTAAALVLWGLALVQRQAAETLRQLSAQPAALGFALGGAFFGPTLGVTASLLAVQKSASIGVASTLMTLAPVFLLPISRFWLKEKVGWQAVVGTMLAIGGVALLFKA